MPQAAQQHRQQQVEARARGAAPVAAERHVEVVAQPAREGHVPAAPELRRVARQVGLAEVGRQLEAEQAGHAARHVGVAGEVEVDLEREAVDGEELHRRGGHARLREDRVDEGREQEVAQHDLLEDAGAEQPEPPPRAARLEASAARELWQELPAPQDRARDELRKEGDEEREAGQARRSLRVAPVHVHLEGQDLEGVEGDAEREQHLGQRRLDPQQGARERRDALDQEGRILEEGQQPEREGHRRGQHQARSGAPLHGPQERVVHADVGEQEQQVGRDPQEVEDQARAQQPAVAAAGREQPVDRQHEHEEDRERSAVEEHQRRVARGGSSRVKPSWSASCSRVGSIASQRESQPTLR